MCVVWEGVRNTQRVFVCWTDGWSCYFMYLPSINVLNRGQLARGQEWGRGGVEGLLRRSVTTRAPLARLTAMQVVTGGILVEKSFGGSDMHCEESGYRKNSS